MSKKTTLFICVVAVGLAVAIYYFRTPIFVFIETHIPVGISERAKSFLNWAENSWQAILGIGGTISGAIIGLSSRLKIGKVQEAANQQVISTQSAAQRTVGSALNQITTLENKVETLEKEKAEFSKVETIYKGAIQQIEGLKDENQKLQTQYNAAQQFIKYVKSPTTEVMKKTLEADGYIVRKAVA